LPYYSENQGDKLPPYRDNLSWFGHILYWVFAGCARCYKYVSPTPLFVIWQIQLP
jgi:hypothetical protein